MTVVIDTRVSPKMRERLLANRRGKLHNEQWREVVTEPIVTLLLLMVPAIMLLRSFLLTLFVGGLWMVGVGALVVGAFVLWRRARLYARIPVHSGIFQAGEKLPPHWMFWKPILLKTLNGAEIRFKHTLAPDKNLQPGQQYLVYYFNAANGNTLLSFAPTDFTEIESFKPSKNFK